MAGRHRKIGARAKRIALLSAATATVTAMTVGVAPPPDEPRSAVVNANIDLAAAIKLLPDHDQAPDITGGLGATIYNGNQALADQLIRAVVNGISLTAFAQAAGLDPQSLVNKLLVDIPANLLPGILATISLDLPILDTLLPALGLGDQGLLTNVLNLIGVDEIANNTLTGLLALLGLDLADPFNLSNLLGDELGVNLVTAGPTFAALKMLGVDLGWVPSLPNSVADDINGTPYLKIGANGLLELVQGLLENADPDDLDGDLLDGILGGLHIPGLPDLDLTGKIAALLGALGDISIIHDIPDVFDLRLTPTIGIGIGAFSAAMAYQKVIDQLKNQPGGAAYAAQGGVNPLLGSLTILPMILLNNPGRPDGGAFARFGALAKLFGIDTVNPHTQLTGSGGLFEGITPIGLHVGGANVLPILVDATYEYQPLSDLASWPNPFTLLNNLAAGLSPTYMLRGLGLDGLTEQLTPQLAAALAAVGPNDPLALNLYLTLHSETLPMLEPLYLTSDALNIVGLSPLAAIPMRLANALAPALTILTNIGYANVVQNADGTYTRDFSKAGTETPFMSFPDIDYGRVVSDVVTQLVGGFQKEFLSGHPSPNTPNALASLLGLLNGGGLTGSGTGTGTPTSGGGAPALNPLGGLGDLLNNVLGGLLGNVFGALNPQAAQQTQALTASSVPSSNARMVSLAADPTGPTRSTGENAAPATETKTDPAGADAKDGTVKDGDTKDDTAKDDTAKDDTAKDGTAKDDDVKDGAVTDQTDTPAADGDTTDNAGQPKTDDQTPPKHAKPDDGSQPATGGTGDDATPPKHAKPDDDKQPGADTTKDESPRKHGPKLNVIRDGAKPSTPRDAKPDGKAGGAESGKKDAERTGAADAAAGSGTSTGGSASGNAA
jgi:hypothetical protein